MPDTGIWGYVRLSREEQQEKGVSMEDKIVLRKQILQTIARHHNLTLPTENITVELKSGGNLSERDGLLDILERCRHKEIHTLICFDIDRLTRDVADLKTITSALYKGEVTLLTQRGADRFDRNHDSTLMQILAVLGEKERRSFSFRRKAANAQRTRAGLPSNGRPPYGYRWDRDAKMFLVEPTEYSLVEEAFRRIWGEGAQSIVRDWNRRGVPPPALGRREDACLTWRPGTLLNMFRNPFYCGYTTHRMESDREGKSVALAPSAWIWADAPGDWPCPVTREQWEEIQEVIRERASGAATAGVLTGLLRCSAGHKMHLKLRSYACECEYRGKTHDGRHIAKSVIEAQVFAALADWIAALPPLPDATVLVPDLARLEAQSRALRSQLREKEATLEDLIRRAGFYVSLPTVGAEGHARLCAAVDAEIAALRAQSAGLEAQQAQSNIWEMRPLLAQLEAAGGIAAYCTDAPPANVRELLRVWVQSIRLDPIERGERAGKRLQTPGLTIAFCQATEASSAEERHLPIPHWRAGKVLGPRRKKQTREGLGEDS